ncbi:MAG: hypothetical protein PHY08_04880 [Candidatus Cloacimonetes bacterium]|nr:hypothetical protein [Candidatus Cloacimonadota bacterium]
MQAIYHLNINELTTEFIDNLKKQFKDVNIDIVVKEFNETAYLNSSKSNKELLDKSINEVNNKELIHKSINELHI